MSETSYNRDTSSTSDHCKLKFYNKRDTRAPLFVADFTNGRIAVNERDKVKFQSFKSANDASNISSEADRTLQATKDRLKYSGSSIQNAPLRTFVAVRNKTTGKMKLYDASMFRMKAILHSSLPTEEPQATTPKNYWDAVNELTESFGSKLKKRALNARKNCESEVSLDQSLVEVPAPISMPGPPVTQGLTYLPAVNRDASDVTEVYDLHSIISPEIDLALQEEAQSLQEASDEAVYTRSKLFCNFVNSQLDKADFTKTKYLIYYNYLVLFQQLGSREIQRKDPLPDVPPFFKNKMLNMFTLFSKSERGGSRRTLPQEMKDKLIAHILILALYICDFHVNVNEVLSDLKAIKPPKFIDIAHALGCHASNHQQGAETIKLVVLRLPLFVSGPKFSKKAFK